MCVHYKRRTLGTDLTQYTEPTPAFFSFTLFDPESRPFRSEATLATEVLPCDSLLSSSKVFVCVAYRASFRRHVVLLLAYYLSSLHSSQLANETLMEGLWVP